MVPGSWRLYVRLSSSIPASFAAQLCVEEGGACVMKENVHSIQMASYNSMLLYLNFFKNQSVKSKGYRLQFSTVQILTELQSVHSCLFCCSYCLVQSTVKMLK